MHVAYQDSQWYCLSEKNTIAKKEKNTITWGIGLLKPQYHGLLIFLVIKRCGALAHIAANLCIVCG